MMQESLFDTGLERRHEHRMRVLKQAYIIFNNRQSTMTARLRDVSGDGCRLRLANPAALPNEFIVYFPSEGSERACRVAWRGGEQMGVQFIDAPAH